MPEADQNSLTTSSMSPEISHNWPTTVADSPDVSQKRAKLPPPLLTRN